MAKIKALIEKNRISLLVFGISLCILSVVYSLFFGNYFVPDHITSDLGGYLTAKPGPYYWYFKGGRPMTFFVAWVNYWFALVGVTPLHNAWVLQVLNMLIMALVVVVIYNLYDRYITDRKHVNWILLALVLIAFVNPMYMENVVFHGYDLAIGVLLAAIATNLFVSKKYIRSIIVLTMSVCIYQIFFELFLVWVTVWLMISVKKKTLTSFGIEYGKMGISAFVSLVVNIVSQKIVLNGVNRSIISEAIENAELIGSTIDADSVYQITEEKPYSGIGTSGVLGLLKSSLCAIKAVLKNVSYPACLFEIITACACVLIIIIMVKKKKAIGEILLTSIALFFLSFYYVVIYLSGSADYAGRIMWPFYACVSGVLIYLFSLIISEKLSCRMGLKYSVVIMFGLLLYYCNIYSTDFFINQSLDRQVMGCIETEIERYEAESGKKVTTIYTTEYGDYEYLSKYLIGNYNFDAYSFNAKTYVVPWSDVELLRWITGRDYHEEFMTDEMYSEIFDGKSWTEFNASEQMIFDGNTLYWAKY